MAIQYLVPVGSRMDPTPLAGRAHFLEHMMSKGSLQYPGYHTFSQEAAKMGAKKNASTGLGLTNYFITTNENSAQKAISLLFSNLAAPEFKTDVLKQELTAVDNEVNVEIPAKPIFALLYSAMDSVEKGHEFSRWDLGTSKILNSMTTTDLKQLYYANYTPEFIKVVISGNFSSGNHSKDIVKKWLQASLKAPSVSNDDGNFVLTEKPLVNAPLPDLVTGKNPLPFIEYGAEDNSSFGIHLLEVQQPREKIDSLALDVLTSYLNTTAPGSLARSLKNKGWIHSLSCDTDFYADKGFFYFIINYTEQGWLHRDEVLKSIYQSISDVKANGIDSYTLEVLKNNTYETLTELFKSAHSSQQAITGIFEANDPDLLKFNFRDALSRISSREIIKAIDYTFVPSKSLNAAIHPSVKSKNINPVFNRPVHKRNGTKLLTELTNILSQPPTDSSQFRPASPVIKTFTSRAEPLQRQSTDWLKHDSTILTVFKEDHSNLEGAFYSSIPLNNVSSFEKHISLALNLSAFVQSISDYLTVLDSRGIYIGLGLSGKGISWEGEGPAEQVKQAYKLVSELYANYKATDVELEKVRLIFISDKESNTSSKFIGSLSLNYAMNHIMNSANNIESIATAEQLTPDKIRRNINKIKISKRPQLFINGDLSPSDLLSFQSSTWNTVRFAFPHASNEEVRMSKPITSKTIQTLPLPEGKALESVGLARILPGPERTNLAEYAAATILGSYLHNAVFTLNRSQKGLGYVHGARASAMGHAKNFIFYGQADSYKKGFETLSGWNEVLETLRTRSVESAIWEQYKGGVLAKLTSKPTTKLEDTKRVGANYRASQSLNFTNELATAVSKISADDIYKIVNKYLARQPLLRIANRL